MTGAKVLARTDVVTDRPGWLDARRKGIGGSDAAAILGLDPFKTPLAVYLDKRGVLPDDDAGEAAEWGNRLEPIVAEAAQDRINLDRAAAGLSPIRFRRRNAILQHPDDALGFMLASIDREGVGHENGPGIFEAKTTGYWPARQWEDGGDTLPDRYHIQLQHYLAVTGRVHGWIGVLIAGQRLVVEEVQRDQALIDALVEIETAFWARVQDGQPPPASAADNDRIKDLYPNATPGSTTVLPRDAVELIDEWRAAKSAEKAATERVKRCDAQIRQLLGDHEAGLLPGVDQPVVRLPVITANRIDSKALRAAHPDIAEQFSKPSSYRRLYVSEGK